MGHEQERGAWRACVFVPHIPTGTRAGAEPRAPVNPAPGLCLLSSLAFPGLVVFWPLESGISTMVWVPTEGQGRDGILHPEPRHRQLRGRRETGGDTNSLQVDPSCRGPGPWQEALRQGKEGLLHVAGSQRVPLQVPQQSQRQLGTRELFSMRHQQCETGADCPNMVPGTGEPCPYA